MAEIIINDDNFREVIDPALVVDGEYKSRGLIPRDYNECPVGYLMQAKPFDLDLIPESEWQPRLDIQKANNSRLSNIRNMGKFGSPMPSTDQNGRGYCWAHSSTSAVLLVRALNNQPYAELSAYAIACIIKNFRDQGGWGSQSLEFIADRGIPTSKTWPQQGTSRSYDNPATWEEAKNYRVTEWMDLQPRNKNQLVTCLLLNIPVVVDYNWWSHSVCAMDLESLNPFRIRIWNSWGDSWSENGTGLLEGNRAIPDGAIAPRVLTAAA